MFFDRIAYLARIGCLLWREGDCFPDAARTSQSATEVRDHLVKFIVHDDVIIIVKSAEEDAWQMDSAGDAHKAPARSGIGPGRSRDKARLQDHPLPSVEDKLGEAGLD